MRKNPGVWRTKTDKLYNCWRAMIDRCLNKNSSSYSYYGGAGISVDAAWRKFYNFESDMRSSFVPGLTLDRKDNTKGYFKENCRWASRYEQCQNRSVNCMITHPLTGEVRTRAEWARIRGVPESTADQRWWRGSRDFETVFYRGNLKLRKTG